MIDRKGILAFLAITFGVTYAIEGWLLQTGFRLTPDAVPILAGQLVVAMVMWVPAIATVITVRFVTREDFAVANVRIGELRGYIVAAVVVPACFALIYGLTWALGLGQPDWQLTELYRQVAAAGAPMAGAPDPPILIAALLIVSLFLTPFVNAVFGFGEELGWRGYLLPKLMPLGKVRAYVVIGIVWGLWHAPLIAVGFNYPGHPVAGIVAMIGLMMAFGVYLNEATLQHRSSILAGWIHGLFNSQAYGIWRVLFPTVNPLLGGITGVVGMAVWLAVGAAYARRAR